MPVVQLVVDALRHVAQVEVARLDGDPGMEHHLEQQVAQLLLHVRQCPGKVVARRVS
jgi:hypothetical protein